MKVGDLVKVKGTKLMGLIVKIDRSFFDMTVREAREAERLLDRLHVLWCATGEITFEIEHHIKPVDAHRSN